MSRWRLIVLAALFATPVLVLAGLGAYWLWWSGWGFWAWWPLTGCLAFGYFLGWRWQSRRQMLRPDQAPPLHWTERDRAAWHLVEERAKQTAQQSGDQLTAAPFYLETAQSLALELARFYHPGAKDPFGSLTIPEMLAVVELAARDLAEMVDEYLPGGHLLTVNDLRRFKQVADWYPMASNITWMISSVFSPVNTALRYLASRNAVSRPWQMLQENLLVWFFTAYVHRVGNYLIELNSGRLRVGAQRYRELQRKGPAPLTGERNGAGDPADGGDAVTFAVIGQAKAGKSSLINALLGEQRALTDVLPATAEFQRFELHPPGVPTRFQLLDTVGYGASGVRENQRRAMEQAARQADVSLLVLNARDPARQADLDVLQGLRQFFHGHPDLRQPPVLAVVTHIDLLSPAMEWRPPYDWQHPQRAKEQNIQAALEAVREQLGEYLDSVVPACTAPGKELGISEWVLPALVGMLDQAHAVALLRCLRAEANAGKVRKVFFQLLAAGKGLAQVAWQHAAAPKTN